MRAALRPGAIASALLLGIAFASAQQGENLAPPQVKGDQQKAQQSEPGRAGTTEPAAQQATKKPEETAAFANGRLTAPDAPADSQTVPAKFSERNAALDALPTMAYPLQLTDEQRQRIRTALAKAPVANTTAQPADRLPRSVEMRELPEQVRTEIPGVQNLAFVRTPQGILLVTSLDRIVVEQIPEQKAAN